MKKKVLFVIDSLNSGGAEKSLVSLLSLFDYERFDVDLLTFKEGGLYVPLLSKNVNLIDSPKIFDKMQESVLELIKKKDLKTMLWRINTGFSLRYKGKITSIKHGAQLMWPRLDKVIPKLEDKYDIAIAYSQGTPTYYVAEKVSATMKVCWINTDYDKAGYSKEFDESYYKKFDYIVTVSEKNREILNNVYPKFENKIKVIYDIISPKMIKKLSHENDGYEDNFKGTRILTIGRHVYLKGYDMAIDAAMLLKKDGINFRWYSIGEGELTYELKEKIKKYNLEENFIFLGTFTNPYPFIKNCDIYCQPSRFEGFGLAIAEAKVLNKIVVATKFDIVCDQIVNGVNGMISDMDGVSIGKIIERLISNSDLNINIINNLKKENIGSEQEIKKIYQLINT